MDESMPAPLTPPECDLQDFPFMPLMVARLRKSKAWVKARRNPAIGFYMLNLWMAAWHEVPAGSLEDDDDVLADAAMCDPAKWGKAREDALRGWVKCSDGRLYHPVVTERVLEAWAAKLARKEKDEHDRDRKRVEREERQQHFATLKSHGIHKAWNTSLTELRQLVHNLSDGQVQDSPRPVHDQSPLREGYGEGEGQGEGYISPSSPPAAEPPAAPADADSAKKDGARKKHGTPEDHDAARWLFAELKAKHPTVREPNFDAWANDVRLMRERDRHSHRDICALFRWVQADLFWSSNVMSPEKLREKWDQLAAKRDQATRRPPAPAPAKFAGAAAAIYGPLTPSAATPINDEGVIDVEARQAA